jgi:HSP90 family molecular chaperone
MESYENAPIQLIFFFLKKKKTEMASFQYNSTISLFSPFYPISVKVIKNILKDKVEKVVVSNRIVDSPCCLATGENMDG